MSLTETGKRITDVSKSGRDSKGRERTHGTSPEAEQALDEAATAEAERNLVADAAGRADLGDGSLAGRGPETAIARDRVAERERNPGLACVARRELRPEIGILQQGRRRRSERAEGGRAGKRTNSVDRDESLTKCLAAEAAEGVEFEKDFAVGRGREGSLNVGVDESTVESSEEASAPATKRSESKVGGATHQ